jgi:hypothetical protein
MLLGDISFHPFDYAIPKYRRRSKTMTALPIAMTMAQAPSVTKASIPTLRSRFFLTKRMVKPMLTTMKPRMNPMCANTQMLIIPFPSNYLMGE